MPKRLTFCIYLSIFAFLSFNANAAITSYTTANGQLRITHNTADEGLYYDCNSSEIAQNIQILKADANAYHTIYHSEPKKTPGSAYPGDSIKTATQTGAFTYSIPSARTFRIFGHPTDTSSTLYSALTYDLNTASSGGANPMVVKGETDPNYYMLFMAVCDENKGHSGTDFRRFLCEAKTPDFSSIYLRTLVNRTVSWKLFNESVDITWRRPDFIYDTGGSIPIRSIRTTDVANAKGLTGSLCYYNGNYYYFYTDVNTDGRTYLYYRTISNISSFLNSDWSTATRVISSALMDDAIVRVAKAKDMDRWAVIYNGYKEIDVNVYQQDVFVQYTQNMNIVGSGGISSLTLYDSFFDIFLCGVSHYGLGLSSSTNDIYTQQYYMTDPYGALDIPGSSSNRGGLLTWADGITYGNNAYWAGWTTSYLTNSYFIPADIDDDGDVDFKDLKEITDSWLITDPTADLYVDSNNTINFKDFSVLNALWEVDRSCLAEICYPVVDKALPGHAATFQWSEGRNVGEYYLKVGTTGVGSSNIFSGSTGTNKSQYVSGMPTNGSTVYVRIQSKINGVWCYNDYTYTAFSYTLAAITSPTPGSTLSSSGVTFQWNTGINVTAYMLSVGTTVGGTDGYNGSETTNTSAFVGGLPTTGCPLYARLWSKVQGHPSTWLYNDYTYTAANYCGNSWTNGDKMDVNLVMRAVGYSNGKYVAVGDEAKIYTSTDAISWTQRTSPISGGTVDFYGVGANGNTLVVAVRDERIIRSTDGGINWSLVYTGGASEDYWCVAYGNGRFVVLGNAGAALVSTSNGASGTWSTNATGHSWRSICFGGGKFVAGTSASQTYTSTDGLNWSNQGTGLGDATRSMAYDNGIWVTGSRNIYRSTNGINWSFVVDINDLGVNSALVTYSSTAVCGKFFIGGDSGTLIKSSDGGQTWSLIPNFSFSHFLGMTSGGGRAVIVSNNKASHANEKYWYNWRYSVCDCNCD